MLRRNDVVQIAPESDSRFGGCFMIVTHPKPWGAQGYMQVPGTAGLAYYRCLTKDMSFIGRAEWVQPQEDDPE